MNIFCNVCIDFLNVAKYERKSYLDWMVSLQVLPRSQLIFPSKTWFFLIYLDFQRHNSPKNQYFRHSKSKSYQLNSIKSSHQNLSKNTKGTFQVLWNFQLHFILIFNEKIIQYSKTFAPQVQTSWNQAHAPLLIERFPKTPRKRFESSQFGGSHKYKIKQNKLPFIIDKYAFLVHNPNKFLEFQKLANLINVIGNKLI